MKKLLLLLLITFSFNTIAQNLEVKGGYFPYWRSTNNINFSNYNYLYFAFAFPTSDGGLQFSNPTAEAAFNSFNSKTQGLDSKRLISIGSTGMPEMASDPTNRLKFADTLRKFCRTHNYDGIDMDWESINNATDRDNFTALMKAIKNEIDTTDLEFVITIGFGNYWLQWYENEALDCADFLQIMIYDQTGTWAQSPYGNHASMDHFKQAETYWVGRGYSRNKLVMGLPYYGYKFEDENGGLATAVTYTEIMNQFPNAQPEDNLLIDGTGHYYFNGANLIKEKINYAKSEGFKGVFVWELAQDDPTSEKSLDAIFAGTVTANEVLEDQKVLFEIYPNPASSIINIIGTFQIDRIEIRSINGKLIKLIDQESNVINVFGLIDGTYLLKIHGRNGKEFNQFFVKK